MTYTSFQTSTTLSMLGSLYPYWESRLLMEYSKDLFTCKVLDDKMIYRRYRLVNGVVYFYDKIYLSKNSKLKNKLLHATYEILIYKPTSFIKTCHTILEGFMWEDINKEMHSHMRMCMDHLLVEEEHSSWKKTS